MEANRKDKNRDPTLFISCNKDLDFDSLIGNYDFKGSNFEFIKGPLLIAMEEGEPILFDEFNLCSDNIFVKLHPIIKANINETINLKEVPYPIKIKKGFLIIATGNSAKENGRKEIPDYILSEISVLNIGNEGDFELNEYTIFLRNKAKGNVKVFIFYCQVKKLFYFLKFTQNI